MAKKYDVFISYRRDGGAETAKLLRDSLTEKGYNVFLDVETLRSGPFNTELYRVIENTEDFLLVLPPDGLKRCSDEQDWVRKEIVHARACEKNIIPIMLRGFEFDEDLPEDLEFLRYQNGISANMEYYDAFVDNVVSFLKSKPHLTSKAKFGIAAVVTVLIAIMAFFGASYLSSYPHNNAQKSTVSELITYYVTNFNELNDVSSQYKKALNDALKFAQDSTTDSLTDIRYDLYNASQSMREQVSSITDPSERLISQLVDSPFDVGQLEAFPNNIRSTMNDYADNLETIRDDYLPNEEMRQETKVSYIKMLQEMADLDGKLLFCEFNEYLLPITNDAALEDLKTQLLPQLTSIFGDDCELSHDASAIKSKEATLIQEYENLITAYKSSIESEKEYWDFEIIAEELEWAKTLNEEYGIDTSSLQDKLQNILDLKDKLDQTRQEVVEQGEQIAEAKREAYEKFKPLETDEQDTLWTKGMKFLAMYMPEEAVECFEMFIENGTADEQQYGTAAKRFAERSATLGIDGGVVVCTYEEGLPHQDVEIGDIIYEVDGMPITYQDDYAEAKEGKDSYTVSVVRLKPDGEEYFDVEFDSDHGRVGYRGLINPPND